MVNRKTSNIIRQIMIFILLPVYIIAGAQISYEISIYFDIWEYYVAAVIIPLLGLVCTWFLAPIYKCYYLVSVYILGILAAYYFAFPAYFPENHALAYQPTYIPFIIALSWGGLITILLAFLTYRKFNYKKSLKQEAY